MSKYIDISSVKPEKVYLSVYAEEPVLMYDKNKIDKLPTADVQEIVYCRDCKYFRETTICEKFSEAFCNTRKENDYCSYGVRKGGERE